ncbi:hypothetical protein GvMRE_I2g259 [endosymbiont GvMRE of Glomus versiforme]|nr:hypothetical protein GvMRE_I2g259 [endosymbiont GvMRE of Glomus versiforme]
MEGTKGFEPLHTKYNSFQDCRLKPLGQVPLLDFLQKK